MKSGIHSGPDWTLAEMSVHAVLSRILYLIDAGVSMVVLKKLVRQMMEKLSPRDAR